MQKKVRKFLGILLSVTMLLSCLTVNTVSVGAADLTVSAAGWFETAYAEWKPVTGAGFYEAYVKKSSDSSYELLDDELVRQYDTYLRADAVGLPAGNYDMKIVAYDKEGGSVIASQEAKNIAVSAYDRSGSCFSSNSTYYNQGIGAYNNDGSLKSGAKVIYVTADTAKTVSTDIIYDNKGGTQTFTGLQDIVYGYQKGYDKTPLAIRIIGTIKDTDMDRFESSAEGLQIKGKNSYAQMNITIEGIGNDAAIDGFGILCRNAGNCEFRNFAIINFMDDGLSLDTDNANIWIHNMDLFYGSPGGDSDQAKGDGSIDVKADSQYVTISYCHFWDSGKCSLCGMSESGDNYITYHHNWFDHSDSRHPRVRVMSVHMYNNYYDGNSKYGAASADSANLFAEANYFRSCKYPFLIGGQGHEAGQVLSGEKGAPIKSYNNIMVGSYKYTDYASDANDYDGYEVSSRSETIPSTVTAAGGTYNNFDTKVDLGVKESAIDKAADVPAIVMAEAGRCNGGDMFFTMYDAEEDINYDVISSLKSYVVNYATSLRVVGGTVVSGATNPSAKATSATGVDGNTTYTAREEAYSADAAALPTASEAPSSSGGSSAYALKLDGTSLGTETLTATKTGLGTDGAFSIIADSTNTVDLDSSKGIKTNGAGSTTKRCITVTIPAGVEDATIYVKGASTSSDTRYIAISDGTTVLNQDGTFAGTDGKDYVKTTIPTGDTGSYGSGTLKSGTYYIYSTYKGINVSLVGVSYGGGSGEEETIAPDPAPDEPTESTTEGPTEDTTEEPIIETTTAAPISGGGTYVWNKTDGTNTLNVTHNCNNWNDASKNPITYDGKTLSAAVKMESNPTMKFDTAVAGKLTIVSYSTNSSPAIKLDGVVTTISGNGAVTVDLPAGSHTIAKSTSNTYIYYLALAVDGGSEPATEATTAAPADLGDKVVVEDAVEFSTSLNSDTSKNPDTGDINYVKNSDGTYTINDANTNRTGYLKFNFAEQTKGTVTIRGSFTPSAASNNWTLVQVYGKKPDATTGEETEGEVFGIRTSGGAYNVRVSGGSDLTATAASIGAGTAASYDFTINFDAQTVKLAVDGKTTSEVSFAGTGITSVNKIQFVTATGTRNISNISVPEVYVSADGSDNPTEATTEAPTTAPTEATTEAPTTEPTTEATTIAPVVEENVEWSTSLNSDTATNPDTGDIYYVKNDDGTYSVIDQNTNRTGYLKFNFAEKSSGKVTISGSFTPSIKTNSWTLAQVYGSKTTAEGDVVGEVFGIRTDGGNYKLRIGGGSTLTDSAAAMTAATAAAYTFAVDFDAKTVELTVDGSSTGAVSFADAGINSVSSIRFVTATKVRNIENISVPALTAEGGEVTTEPTTEATTEAPTTEPVDRMLGDVNNDKSVDSSDATQILLYRAVLLSLDEASLAAADVNGDGAIDSSDATQILLYKAGLGKLGKQD